MGPELTVPSKPPRCKGLVPARRLQASVGHSPYESKVSGRTERLPIAISMLSSPGRPHLLHRNWVPTANPGLAGRDLELFDIAYDCLTKAGRPVTVHAGGDMF